MNAKRIFTFAFLLFSFQNLSFGQSEEYIRIQENPKSTIEDSINTFQDEVFMVVEDMPEFPGGNDSLVKFLNSNIVYPKSAFESGLEGTVYVSFVVEKDGAISSIKVMRSIDQSLSDEAERVISRMPKWKPGQQRGKLVRTMFMLPIKFKLS